jgi:uncharacterized protein YndB with AHSA1/START domain
MATMASSGAARVTLPTEEQILITREFDVPKDLIYEAWTKPALVRRWWSGERGEMTIAEIDLRVGGRWRFVMVAADGAEAAFHGEYRQIVTGERLVYTEVFDAMPDTQALTAVTFSELDGLTTLEVLVQYESRRERDAHAEYMRDGLQEALDLLEQTAVAVARSDA